MYKQLPDSSLTAQKSISTQAAELDIVSSYGSGETLLNNH
jgi:hypothetical protein